MCWKHEWAKAINNLEWAKIHIERARIKVEKRNMDDATRRCEQLLKTLEDAQKDLRSMIDSFGISRKSLSRSLEKKMRGRRKVKGKIKEWIETN